MFVSICVLLLGLLAPQLVEAQFSPVNPCPISFLSCSGGGGEGLKAFFWFNIFPIMRILFLGLALLMFAYYAIQLLFTKHEESAVAEAKTSYEMAVFGCALIMTITLVMDAFAPDNTGPIVRVEPVQTIFNQAILYIKIILATVIVARLTMLGMRMILLQGQTEGELDKQKQSFFYILIGVAVILLANTIVSAVLPGANSAIIAVEVRGIANFLLEIAGALAVFSVIIAGVMLVVSVDESFKDRAKKIITGSVIAIIIILVSFVLVNYFLSL